MTYPMASTDSRNWAAIGHLSAFVQFIGIPSFVGEQAKEALNFNISMMIWFIASAIAIVLLIGLVLLPVIAITWFVLVLVATIKASNGEEYRYPLTIRFVS